MGSNNKDDTPRCSKGVLVMFLGVFALGMLIVLFSFTEHAHSPFFRSNSPFFDLVIEDASGNSFPIKNMITHPGAPSEKLYLITNLASNCGLTHKNYPELQKLYERYQDRGFEVMGFPCNDFKEQEPGTNEEIQHFAKLQGATFPVFGKVLSCAGASITTHPLFKYLIANSPPPDAHRQLRWNFEKFLVSGSDGKVLKRFHPKQNPFSFEADIVAILDKMEGIS